MNPYRRAELSDEEIAMAVAQYVRERRPPSARFVAEETRRQQAAAGRGGAADD